MAKLHYLTVQDILWINLQATKKVQHFSYAKLEESAFYQYAYGDSQELVGQAARFLAGFGRLRPLEAGNEATAFLAAATFLLLNGARLNLDDDAAAAWYGSASSSAEAAKNALGTAIQVDDHHDAEHKMDVRTAVRAVMACYPRTTAALAV